MAPRPRSEILYIYGGFVRRLGGWLPVSALLTLMADLQVEPPLVRAAVARMKSSGLLTSSRRPAPADMDDAAQDIAVAGARSASSPRAPRRRASVAGYALTPRAWQILDDGDRRILRAREPASLADGWVLVIFSVPESHRHHRHQLRNHLGWLGFGAIGAGAWIAPRRLRAELETNLQRAGLLEYTERFDVGYEGLDSARHLAEKCWDLPGLGRMYTRFAARWEPVLERWCMSSDSPSPREAFRDYINLVGDWRRLPFLDPGLPAEVLPETWPGEKARQTYFALLGQIDPLALAHVQSTATP